MGPEQEITKEQRLTEALEHQQRMTNNAHMTIGHLQGDLIFWKRLALHQLGVDESKINQLVHSAHLGGATASAGASLSRGY